MLPVPEPEQGIARVLVVEDELLLRVAVSSSLRESGFSVVEAASAEDALSYLSAGGHVDFVFSDIELEGALSGIDLADLIGRDYPSLPVLLASGGAEVQVGGGITFLPKPYDYELVAAIIANTLGLRSRRSST